MEQRTPVTDDSKGRVSDKDKPVKPEERPSVLEKMKMRKKEIDQKERAERSRGYRVIKHVLKFNRGFIEKHFCMV